MLVWVSPLSRLGRDASPYRRVMGPVGRILRRSRDNESNLIGS